MTAYVRKPGDFSDEAYRAAHRADLLNAEKKERRAKGELTPISPRPPFPSPTSPSGRLTMKDLDIKVDILDRRLRRVETKLNQVLRSGIRLTDAPKNIGQAQPQQNAPPPSKPPRSPMKDYLDAFLEKDGRSSPSRLIPASVLERLSDPLGYDQRMRARAAAKAAAARKAASPSPKRRRAAPKPRVKASPKAKPETAAARKQREAKEAREAKLKAEEDARLQAIENARLIKEWKEQMDVNDEYIAKVQKIIDTEGFYAPFFRVGEYVPRPILDKYSWDRTKTGHIPQFRNYRWRP